MTIIWLAVWFLSHMPKIDAFASWNAWGIAITLSVVVDAAALTEWLQSRKHSLGSSAPSLRRVARFTRHFVEMGLAMVLGTLALGVTNSVVLVPAGFHYLSYQYPETHLVGMALFMSVPMVAWMRFRGHGWEMSAEMAGAMFVPAVCAIAVCSIGFLPRMSMLSLGHQLMWIAMLGVMLFRWSHYAGEMHVHGAPPTQVPALTLSKVR